MDANQTEVEQALLAKAQKGDIKAITFYLCNRDPDRWKPLSQAGQEITAKRKKIQIITTEEVEDNGGTDSGRTDDAQGTDGDEAPPGS